MERSRKSSGNPDTDYPPDAACQRMENLSNEWEDLIVLCEMGIEEGDQDLLDETKTSVEKLRDYDTLRLETLFTDEYDCLNAILTLHAGAGGTEAQDWTSMLYRMYIRAESITLR